MSETHEKIKEMLDRAGQFADLADGMTAEQLEELVGSKRVVSVTTKFAWWLHKMRNHLAEQTAGEN